MLDALIANYMMLVDEGSNVTPQEFIDLHPDQRQALLQYFGDIEQVDRYLLDDRIQVDTHSAANYDTESLATVEYQNKFESLTAPSNGRKNPNSEPARIGEYEILGTIGRGGMGVVYKAWQPKLNRVVALKTILKSGNLDDQQIQRFIAEAESMAILDHPGIVRIYDIGESDGTNYFTMEFIDGESLSGRIQRNPLVPKTAAKLVAESARILQFAHEQGVIHRDIKPGNILLDHQGRPHISDFGLAKKIDSGHDLTLTGQILGTPGFMPPEQALGTQQVGKVADVYALGAVLFMALTGRAPFQAATPIETLRQVIDDEPASLTALNSNLPQDLETICRKCLDKNPAKRFQSAEELAEELDRFGQGVPIHSRPITRIERGWRWCVRNPQLATALTLLVLVLIAGTTVSTVFGVRSTIFGRRASKLAIQRKELLDDLQNKNNALVTEKSKVEEQKNLANARANELSKRYFYAGLSRAWDSYQLDETRLPKTLLNQIRPKKGETDLRGIVWHDLWERLNGFEWEQKTFYRRVYEIPGTQKVIARGLNSDFRIFDVEKQQEVARHAVKTGLKLVVHPDGKMAATLIEPDLVRFIDLKQPGNHQDVTLPAPFYKSGDPLYSQIRFMDDPHRVAVSHYPTETNPGYRHEISIVDAKTKTVGKSFPAVDYEFDLHDNRLVYLAPSKEPTLSNIVVVDLNSSDQLQIETDTRSTGLRELRMFRWLGKNRFAYSNNARVQTFYVRADKITKTSESFLNQKIWDLSYSKAYDQLLVRVENGCLQIFSPVTLKRLGKIPCADAFLYSFAAVGNGECVVVVADGFLRRWNLSPRTPGRNAYEHVRVTDRGTLAWEGTGRSNTLLYWLPSTANPQLKRWSIPRTLIALEILPGQSKAIAISGGKKDTNLEVIDLENGKTEMLVKETPLNMAGIEIDPASKKILTFNYRLKNSGDPTGPIQVRNAETLELIRKIDGKFHAAKFADAGRKIIAVSNPAIYGDTSVQVHDTQTGELLWKKESSNREDQALCVTVSENGRLFAVGSSNLITIYDLDKYELVKAIPADEYVSALAFAGDNLVAIEGNKALRYWNFELEEQVLRYEVELVNTSERRQLVVDSQNNFVRIEPDGFVLGRRRLLEEFAVLESESKTDYSNLSPLINIEMEAAVQRANAIVSSVRSTLDHPTKSNVEKLKELRLARRELKELLTGRESQPKLLEPYSVFCYWFADFVRDLDASEAEELLTVAEMPEWAYDRAYSSWAATYNRSGSIKARVMMGGALNNKAIYNAKQNQLESAIFELGRAIDIQKNVLSRSPDHKTAQAFLKNHYVTLVETTIKANRFDKLPTVVSSMLELSTEQRLVNVALDSLVALVENANSVSEENRKNRLDEAFFQFKKIMAKIPNGLSRLKQHPDFEKCKEALGDRWKELEQRDDEKGDMVLLEKVACPLCFFEL